MLSDKTIDAASGLDHAILLSLQLHPTLSAFGPSALSLVSSDRPLLLIVDDINQSGQAPSLAEKIARWCNSPSAKGARASRWRLVVPPLAGDRRSALRSGADACEISEHHSRHLHRRGKLQCCTCPRAPGEIPAQVRRIGAAYEPDSIHRRLDGFSPVVQPGVNERAAEGLNFTEYSKCPTVVHRFERGTCLIQAQGAGALTAGAGLFVIMGTFDTAVVRCHRDIYIAGLRSMGKVRLLVASQSPR